MNTRVLELLKKPELLAKEDLGIIEKEIQKMPFVQSIRALYLCGVHQFHPEVYQQELSKTAAYTTDKKILYFLVNKDKKQPTPIVISDINEEEIPVSVVDNKVETTPTETIQEAVEEKVEEEENLPHFYHEPMEIEMLKPLATISSVNEKELIKAEETEISTEPISEESNIVDDEITTEKVEEVSFSTQDVSEDSYIYSKKLTEEEKISTDFNSEINFYQVDHQQETDSDDSLETTEQFSYNPMDFYSKPQQNPIIQPEIIVDADANVQKELSVEADIQQEMEPSTHQEYIWKPMQIDAYLPKTVEQKLTNIPQEEPAVAENNSDEEVSTSESLVEETLVENEEERPVLNVSFFSNDLEKIEKEEEIPTEKEEEKTELPKQESNVSSFINTWQNWLKISDNTSTAKPLIEKKALVIDKFIENSPKISPMKEESDFVVKEKKDDISHLMTETLAQLYVEQKLFSRAIKAYEILQEKFPEKKEHFKEEIDKIRNRS